MTERTFTAANVGDALVNITCPIGTIDVTVDPKATHITIVVSTEDTEGPVADAVRSTLWHEVKGTITLSVPEIGGGRARGGFTSVSYGNSSFQSFGNGSTFNGINVSGVGITVEDGALYMGGTCVVRDGVVVAETGTRVGGSGYGSISVRITVPTASSALTCETTSASVRVHGNLEVIHFHSVSGSLAAAGAYTLRADTTSGAITADMVYGEVDAESVSGRILIGAYNGDAAKLKSVSGSLTLSATPAARGQLTARTVSGAISLRGTGALDVRTRTVSGHISR